MAMSSGGQQKDDFIKPSRPTEAEPADIQKAGVLQLEFGVDAPFDAEEFRNQQTTPLRLRFDAGLRFGVGAEAPLVSVVAGFTVGVVDLYGK
jgi:hypothetical protein